ncbi:MAG: hypothetical protein U9Q62_03760 [Campylobacterota bacterium]|nr:hypothetical protein [Campylobacterota bacterium]
MKKLFAVLAFLFLFLGCSRTMMSFDNNQIVESIDLSEITYSIKKAAVDKGWRTKVVEPGHIMARIAKGNDEHILEVDIHYTTTSYSIKYRDSKNMKHEGYSIHRGYNTWVSNLKTHIDKQLSITDLSVYERSIGLGESK